MLFFFESFAYFKNQNLKFEDQKMTTFVSVLNRYMCVYLYMCVCWALSNGSLSPNFVGY